jgi:hypothetical protein
MKRLLLALVFLLSPVLALAQDVSYSSLYGQPLPASAIPATEAIGGAIGSEWDHYATANHQHPRITRAAIVTTDASGNWSVTWATALLSVPAVITLPVNSGSQPVICNVLTRTTTSATGKCWNGQTTLLSLSIVTTGLTLNAFTNPAAGTSIQVVALPLTQ